jgi:hypothetical protein
MSRITEDETADFLIRQIRFLKRVGTPQQKAAAPQWERLVLAHAQPEQMPQMVDFASGPTVQPAQQEAAK